MHQFGYSYLFSLPLPSLSLLSPECHENTGKQPSLILPENSPTFAKEWKQRGRNQWHHKPSLPPGTNERKVTQKRAPFPCSWNRAVVRKQVHWIAINSLWNRILLIGSGGSGSWEVKSIDYKFLVWVSVKNEHTGCLCLTYKDKPPLPHEDQNTVIGMRAVTSGTFPLWATSVLTNVEPHQLVQNSANLRWQMIFPTSAFDQVWGG